jgi:signal transduction histidine kinase
MSIRVGKPKTSRGLAATLAIAFLALNLAALLIAYIPQFLFFLQTRQEAVDSQQQLTAHDAANTVASFIQEKFSELEAAARIGEPLSASPDEQRNVLGNLLGLDHAFRQLVLLDSQEQELATASRLSQAASGRLTDRAESDFFIQVRQGNRYISPVYVDDVTSEPLVIMAVPATDVFGGFQGALMAELNLKFMWDLVGRLKIGETGLAYVVDRQGNLIAFGDIARVLRGENVGHLKEVGEFIRNPASVDETGANVSLGINGTTIVGTYVPLGTPDWAVMTELPVKEAYREVIRGAVISVGVMLVMAILAGLVGVNVARRLAVPLLNLTETATRIAGGETELQATIGGPAEVVSLAMAFNSMTAQLRELIGSLEQRVAERTRNLRAAAEVSSAASSILDPETLITQVVDLIRERFGLYYVGLFLVDQIGEWTGEPGRWAVLRAGTGEAGQRMVKQGHKLEVGGSSMIGWCVANKQARVALNVDEEAMRFENPLLPETRSEMALPLISRGEVIGALSVQSAQEVTFSEEDVAVFQTMAGQLANAVANARLYDQAQVEIAERKRAEEALARQTQELARSNAELEQFAYIASHDLQEPLRKVQAFGDRLKAKYGGVLGDQGRDYLERMRGAAARMQTLINSLLTYSRVTTKARPFAPVDLSKVVQEVLSDLEVRIEQVGGRVEVGDLSAIEADPTQMRQLLQNLIGNALKFHREGETPVVKIHAESLNGRGEGAVGVCPGDGLCQIIVEDNGIGFDEKYVERIFQIFQRLHGRSEYEGTGIGLATCRKIVERHGGSITAKSTPGQGATFIVTLPIEQSEGGKRQ